MRARRIIVAIPNARRSPGRGPAPPLQVVEEVVALLEERHG
jgi:hypothetical protein